MSSQIGQIASNIDPTYPVPGVNQSSQGFRTNALATQNALNQAATEMNDVINKAIVSAPLTYGANTNINNFGSMINSNFITVDSALQVSNITASVSNAVPTLNFANTAVANIFITSGSPTTQTINISNFPNNGYSEMVLEVSAQSIPQFLNFSAITPGSTINRGGTISSFDTGNANLTLGSTQQHIIRLGSSDGVNWNISMNGYARARNGGPPNSVGVPGDVQGDIAVASGFIYVCNANYDGINPIWQRAALASY